ncbi:hypothetical protein BD413DRAFT_567311 [Trametes elegans]|nr:hypothetical protein BD413DRAFT_567311 [Trametes elegans]
MASARKPHYCRSCKDPEGNRVPLKGHRCPLRRQVCALPFGCMILLQTFPLQPFSVARTPPSEAVDSHVNTPPSSPIIYTSPTSSSSPSAHALTPAAGSSNPSPRYINMSISDLDDFMNSLHTLSSSPVNSPSHPSSPVPYTPKPPPAIGSTELSTPPFNCFLVDGMQTPAVSDRALNAGEQVQNVMSNSAATSPNDDLNMYFHMESSPNRTVPPVTPLDSFIAALEADPNQAEALRFLGSLLQGGTPGARQRTAKPHEEAAGATDMPDATMGAATQPESVDHGQGGVHWYMSPNLTEMLGEDFLTNVHRQVVCATSKRKGENISRAININFEVERKRRQRAELELATLQEEVARLRSQVVAVA